MRLLQIAPLQCKVDVFQSQTPFLTFGMDLSQFEVVRTLLRNFRCSRHGNNGLVVLFRDHPGITQQRHVTGVFLDGAFFHADFQNVGRLVWNFHTQQRLSKVHQLRFLGQHALLESRFKSSQLTLWLSQLAVNSSQLNPVLRLRIQGCQILQTTRQIFEVLVLVVNRALQHQPVFTWLLALLFGQGNRFLNIRQRFLVLLQLEVNLCTKHVCLTTWLLNHTEPLIQRLQSGLVVFLDQVQLGQTVQSGLLQALWNVLGCQNIFVSLGSALVFFLIEVDIGVHIVRHCLLIGITLALFQSFQSVDSLRVFLFIGQGTSSIQFLEDFRAQRRTAFDSTFLLLFFTGLCAFISCLHRSRTARYSRRQCKRQYTGT